MVEIKVFGGLGNQMFQYALYRYLEPYNDKVYLNISDYKVHNHHQGFELERVFGINGPYIASESKNAVKANSVIIRSLQKLLRARICASTEYYEHKEISFIAPEKINTDVYLVGFWQNVKYIEPVKDQLIKDFAFRKELDEKNKQFLKSISEENTVSVHVRRGDYLKAGGLAGVCDEEYYSRAFDQIASKVKNAKFVFFSDDINWCKEKFGHLNSAFVDWNSGENSYIDMQLMSLCKHNIIANSTFSWWGAFLNTNAEKIVVCPKIWNSKYNVNQLVMPGWITI